MTAYLAVGSVLLEKPKPTVRVYLQVAENPVEQVFPRQR